MFFFNDTATTEIYTLSLHDALPISRGGSALTGLANRGFLEAVFPHAPSCRRTSSSMQGRKLLRSEEHTSELQSRQYLVCRLLLEKKKQKQTFQFTHTLLVHIHICIF